MNKGEACRQKLSKLGSNFCSPLLFPVGASCKAGTVDLASLSVFPTCLASQVSSTNLADREAGAMARYLTKLKDSPLCPSASLSF